jgi:hypothetical protein
MKIGIVFRHGWRPTPPRDLAYSHSCMRGALLAPARATHNTRNGVAEIAREAEWAQLRGVGGWRCIPIRLPSNIFQGKTPHYEGPKSYRLTIHRLADMTRGRGFSCPDRHLRGQLSVKMADTDCDRHNAEVLPYNRPGARPGISRDRWKWVFFRASRC